MLGGTRAVAQASMANSESIECSLRPGDLLAHPIFGVLTPTSGVLLKVVRKRMRQAVPMGDSRGAWQHTAEALGVVTTAYRFDGLADYQHVSHPSVLTALNPEPLPDGCRHDVRANLEPLAEHAMRIPPSLFSMYDTSLDYLPRKGTSGGSKEAADEHGASKRRRGTALSIGKPLPPRRRRSSWGDARPMHFGQRIDFDAAAVCRSP